MFIKKITVVYCKIMPQKNNSTIGSDSYTSISSNAIWNIKNHFASSGTEMFENKIPFWITANPVLAHHVAEIIIKSIQDILKTQPNLKNEEILIIECGSGLGKFGFYCIKKCLELLALENYSQLNIKYILTELSDPLINSWLTNDSLQPYFDNNTLDCAIVDMSKPLKSITCKKSKKTITLSKQKFPVFFIGNYIWDSIPFDCYKIKDHQLHETQLKLDYTNQQPANFDFKNIALNFKDIPCEKNPYDDPYINDYINQMNTNFKNISFTIPTTALQFINSIKTECKQGAIFISSDKGFSKIDHFFADKNPSFIGHDSYFSCSVNFHCIENYLNNFNTQSITPAYPDTSIDTFIYAINVPPLTSVKAYMTRYENQCTAATMAMVRKLLRNTKTLTVKQLLYNFYLSQFDPEMFNLICHQLFDKIATLSQKDKHRLINALNNFADNLFIQHKENEQIILINLAVCYIRLNLIQTALNLLLKAQSIYKADAILNKNIAICYEKLNNKPKAELYYERAKKQPTTN